MQTFRSLQIIIIGSAAIVLLLALRIIFGDDRSHKPTPVWKAFNHHQAGSVGESHSPSVTRRASFVEHTEESPPQPMSQVIYYDPRGETELAMIAKMKEALATLGLEKDERTVSRLVFARVAADWCKEPESFRNAPEWAGLQSMKLKRKIAWLLATNDVPADELTIERIYTAPIGPEPPPVKDWSIIAKPNDAR